MIETQMGLSALDEILDVQGIDGVFIGPYDLSLSLGEASVTSDAMVAAIDKVVAATSHRNQVVGIFSGNSELTRRLPDMDLLGVDADAGALRTGLEALFGSGAAHRRVS